jgi:hypothetical protein
VINDVKDGSAIPVKFSLGGDQGLDIFAAGYPKSGVTAWNASASSNDTPTVTAGSSSLSYDAATDQYVYVWKTDKAWAGTCRILTVKLIDGTIHTALFQVQIVVTQVSLHRREPPRGGSLLCDKTKSEPALPRQAVDHSPSMGLDAAACCDDYRQRWCDVVIQ